MHRDDARERGQASILLVGIVLATLMILVAMATLSRELAQRSAAQTAADAVALAVVTDPEAATDLAGWYRQRGIEIDVGDHRVEASIGGFGAVAQAVLSAGDTQTAPSLRAIVARAEQLRGVTWSVHWSVDSFTIANGEVGPFADVAAEFGLCALLQQEQSGFTTFGRC